MPPHLLAPSLSRFPTSTSASSAPTSLLPTSCSQVPKPPAKKCGKCRSMMTTANSSRAPSPTSRISAAAKAVAPSPAPCSSRNSPATPHGFTSTSLAPPRLHLLRRLNSHQIQRAHQLRFHQLRQTQQKRTLLLIRLGQNMVLVVKIVEGLRQVKRILSDKCRLPRADCGIHGVIQRPNRQQYFPQPIAFGAR